MNWTSFIIQANLYLILLYGFYRSFLQNDTFHNMKRIYLLGAVFFSFLIPFWQSEMVQSWFITEKIRTSFGQMYLPQTAIYKAVYNPIFEITFGQILFAGYVVGLIFFTLKFLIQLYFLGKNIYFGHNTKSAFSFFNYIFVNNEIEKQSTIIDHEYVHASQMHSADVLVFEILSVVFWFNPVVYFYKNAVKSIHEFIADDIASQNEESKAEYATLLFNQQFGIQAIPLTNNFFNKSILKERIKMLMKDKSPRRALIKYGFTVPLFIVMLITSSAFIAKNKAIEKIETATETTVFQTSDNGSNFDLDKALIVSPGLFVEKNKATEKDDDLKSTQLHMILVTSTLNPNTPLQIENNLSLLNSPKEELNVYTSVDVAPTYLKGNEEFYKLMAKNLRYPNKAKNENKQGVVFASFIVKKDGNIGNIKILKSNGNDLDQEVIRAINLSGKWNAGRVNDNIVDTRMTIPIEFYLEDERQILENKEALILEARMDSINATQLFTTNGKIILIDDIIVSKEEMNKLNLSNINSLTILDKDVSLKNYGDAGKQGAVLISTKIGNWAKAKDYLKITKEEDQEEEIFTVVDENAAFPGGNAKLVEYLSKNMKYPKEALKANVKGKVFLSFVVTKTGKIKDISVLKGIGFGCDEEAKRVVENMPAWIPAKQNGKVVNSKFNFPLEFQLE